MVKKWCKNGGDNSVDATQTTGATFKANSIKLYVPVFTLSININIKFSEIWYYYQIQKLRDLKEKFVEINIDLK